MRGEHFAKHNPVRGALLRCFASFQSFRSCHHNMNVARFLYQIRLLRFVPRSPFPFRLLHPVSGFVPFLLLQRPCKTLARSYSPFPASLRYTASSTAIPRPRRCCFSPRNGASAADAAGHLARLQRTSNCKVTNNFGNCKL